MLLAEQVRHRQVLILVFLIWIVRRVASFSGKTKSRHAIRSLNSVFTVHSRRCVTPLPRLERRWCFARVGPSKRSRTLVLQPMVAGAISTCYKRRVVERGIHRKSFVGELRVLSKILLSQSSRIIVID